MNGIFTFFFCWALCIVGVLAGIGIASRYSVYSIQPNKVATIIAISISVASVIFCLILPP
jgi:hypothetical protein